MAVKTTHPRRGKDQAANPAPADNGQSISTGGPQFGESTPTPDPTKFTVKHGSDNNAYSILDHEKGKLKPLPFKIAEDVEPVLQLADALGHTGANIVAQRYYPQMSVSDARAWVVRQLLTLNAIADFVVHGRGDEGTYDDPMCVTYVFAGDIRGTHTDVATMRGKTVEEL